MTPIFYMLAGWLIALIMVCLFYEIRAGVERRWWRQAKEGLDTAIKEMEKLNAMIGGEISIVAIEDDDPKPPRDPDRFH